MVGHGELVLPLLIQGVGFKLGGHQPIEGEAHVGKGTTNGDKHDDRERVFRHHKKIKI